MRELSNIQFYYLKRGARTKRFGRKIKAYIENLNSVAETWEEKQRRIKRIAKEIDYKLLKTV